MEINKPQISLQMPITQPVFKVLSNKLAGIGGNNLIGRRFNTKTHCRGWTPSLECMCPVKSQHPTLVSTKLKIFLFYYYSLFCRKKFRRYSDFTEFMIRNPEFRRNSVRISYRIRNSIQRISAEFYGFTLLDSGGI